ncbi:MAG: acylneuraminate cytidylyltransferase family protein [Porticoccaceae bacterium]
MNLDNFCTLIPLRGGSKGIPKKNIKSMAGKPLCYWAIKASLDAGIKTFVSTDSEEIKNVVLSFSKDVTVIDRPEDLASDTATTEAVIEHAFSLLDYENMILMQATSPLTTSKDLLAAIELYEKNERQPLVTGTKSHRFNWDLEGNALNYNPLKRPRRQDWDGFFQENGAFYIFTRDFFKKTGARCGPKCSLYIMEEQHALEIDSLQDWEVMEMIAPRYLENTV